MDWLRKDGSALGALHGCPIGLKDIIEVRGMPHGCGSPLMGQLSETNAALVDALEAAGAVILGKTETTEFAALHPARTKNPHSLGHSPGGSSAGSAAAVAADDPPPSPPLTSPCCTLLPILSALPLRRLFPPASKIAAASSPPRRQLSRAPKISRPVFALSRFALALSSSARLDTTPCSLLSCSTRTSVSRVDLSCCCSLGKL